MMNDFIRVKSEAINLRKRGKSVRRIGVQLRVSKSTLSGWFKDINLTENQRLKLRKDWMLGLVKAREKAARHHRRGKEKRLQIAERNAILSMNAVNLKNKNILKMALSMLFIGEGFKAAEETSLGNSDPTIVKAFVRLIDEIYGLEKKRLRLYLNLRADQSKTKELKFWSDILEIESTYFKIAPTDKRTIGKKTFPNYHGVCVVRYYDVSIKRELLALANNFFKNLIR